MNRWSVIFLPFAAACGGDNDPDSQRDRGLAPRQGCIEESSSISRDEADPPQFMEAQELLGLLHWRACGCAQLERWLAHEGLGHRGERARREG